MKNLSEETIRRCTLAFSGEEVEGVAFMGSYFLIKKASYVAREKVFFIKNASGFFYWVELVNDKDVIFQKILLSPETKIDVYKEIAPYIGQRLTCVSYFDPEPKHDAVFGFDIAAVESY